MTAAARLASVVLFLLFLAGTLLPRDPDFDVLFGVARPDGIVAAAACLAGALLLANERVGDRLARLTRVGPLLAVLAAVVLFVALPDTSLSGDAGDIAARAAAQSVQMSSPLTGLLHVLAAHGLGLDGVTAVRGVSWVAGLAGVVAGIALARELFADGPRRVAAGFLVLTTAAAALFFGSIEAYAPLGAALLAYLWAAVRAARGGSLVPAALFAGLAVALHGIALLMVPSLLVVAWRRARIRGVATGALAAVPAVASVVLVRALGLAEPGSGDALGALGESPFVPLVLDPADVRPRYALVDLEHTVAVLSTLFLAAPAAWALLAVRARNAVPPERALTVLAWTALLPWLAFPFVWNVSYGLSRDWDLFAAAGVPLALLAAVLVLREPISRGAAIGVAGACLVAFVPFVVDHAGSRGQRRVFALAAAHVVENAPDPRGEAFRERAAGAWFERAVRLDTERVGGRIEQAEVLAPAGEIERAVTLLGEALAAEPRNAYARQMRGLYLLRLGRRDEARRDFERSLADGRENERVPARHELGRMALEDGDLATAIRHLERGLREDGEHRRAAQMARDLADAHRRLGRTEVAAALERFAETRER